MADAISLLRHVDGVIVAASVNSTRGPDARRLRDQLQGLDARVLGVVANGGTATRGYGYAYAPSAPGSKATGIADSGGNGRGTNSTTPRPTAPSLDDLVRARPDEER